jgi:hypothetical protein
LYQPKSKAKMISHCPYCGKESPAVSIGATAFCNMVCETNYRYKQRHKDVLTGKEPSNKKISKI